MSRRRVVVAKRKPLGVDMYAIHFKRAKCVPTEQTRAAFPVLFDWQISAKAGAFAPQVLGEAQ
jgi:hypothetical protein